jgi:xanthine dehydrogenase YagR molybdenum-binding subunit
MNAVGQPISRADGRLKVTGAAQYTADIPVKDAVHAALVHSTIANGRAISIDTGAAEEAAGVLAVFTYRNLPRMNPTPQPWSHLHPHGQGYLPLQDDKIHYAGQPVALVIAETRDAAAFAGTLIEVEYSAQCPVVFSRNSATEAVEPPQFLWPVTSSVGDPDRGIAEGAIRIDETYTTADRHHNQMEPHATIAVWDEDGSLTLYETTQHIFGARDLVSIVLGMPPEKINVVCQFLGGGFGGKAYVWPHTLLTALAARIVGRPVKLQLTRAQMYTMAGHQPATIQRVVLGADRDGRLTGIRHDSISPTPVFDSYIEYAATASRSLWAASGGIATNHKVVHVNRNTPTAMRSPHEALGHFALESAMDELAYKAGIDPVALRLRNDTETDPLSGRLFSTRAMRKCLLDGAARFGWEKRSPEPRSMRHGRYLVGQGMAAAIYTHWRWPAKARVTLKDDGTALVETGTHDLGTGTYTVLRQVAADALGLPPEMVTVRLGDTRLPASHASIGSATMANAGASVMLAAVAVRERAMALSENNPNVGYAELLAQRGGATLSAEADYDPVPESDGPKAVFSFAAVFAEVRVDPELGSVRLNRVVGAYDAGRIINPKTARSQAIGGIIWGAGQALLEQSEMDPRTVRFLSRNCSGYLVPTNADIPELDVLFVGEFDAEASPLGAKGLGELTAVSVAPAIANAVHHATGKRIRDMPITIEKLL